MTQITSITNLRNNIFDIFNNLEKAGGEMVVEKDGKKIAVIKKYQTKEVDWEKYKKELEKGIKYLRSVGWKENKNFRKSFKFTKW